MGMINDDQAACREIAARMAQAARAWLETLDAGQRTISRGAVPADDREDNERRRWFYTPTDHGDLTIHQQRPAQQRAAMRLISTGPSPAAYVTVATIMGLETCSTTSRDSRPASIETAAATLACATCESSRQTLLTMASIWSSAFVLSTTSLNALGAVRPPS